MYILRIVMIAAVALAWTASARAGGDWEPSPSYCYAVDEAHELLNLNDIATIREEVRRRYYHALDVSMAPQTISTTTPLFTWATAAKVSCAKAWGFLKRKYIYRPEMDVEMVQRCECFYSRMQHHSGWR